VKISIPRKIIDPVIEQILCLLEIETKDKNIGKVCLLGSWNFWGHSEKRAGCIGLDPDLLEITEMKLVENNYVIEIPDELLPREGVIAFKPAVVSASNYNDGMHPASWIACPEEGVRDGKKARIYHREKGDAHGNWLFKITSENP